MADSDEDLAASGRNEDRHSGSVVQPEGVTVEDANAGDGSATEGSPRGNGVDGSGSFNDKAAAGVQIEQVESKATASGGDAATGGGSASPAAAAPGDHSPSPGAGAGAGAGAGSSATGDGTPEHNLIGQHTVCRLCG